ncbi:MAG: sensor histidine kinase [Anaerolineales bacterium]|jgi:signal transduction histidine kinase
MQTTELLEEIRADWIQAVSSRIAHGESLRQSVYTVLEQFFDHLVKAAEEQNPKLLDEVLDAWSEVLTQSDLEERSSALSELVNTVFESTFEISRVTFLPDTAITLFSTLYPIQKYAIQSASQKEKNRELDHLQQQMTQMRNELERLDRSKSDFIAVAAHELKTPLTLIEGYAAMLREMLMQEGASEYKFDLVDGMDQGADRLRRIIDDMIDVSLIDNDLLTLNFQPIWLNRLFDILKEEFGASVKLRQQELLIQAFDGSAEMIFADPERIYQAFRNLISNAIKFTPNGGKIAIDGRKLPGFIEITFTDTGIGIAIEDQARIFDKFIRTGDAALHSSGTFKFKGGGPGLGLAITKGIIEAHGGALWVESDGYDEVQYPGSIFHVLIPERRESPDEQIARLFRPLKELDRK